MLISFNNISRSPTMLLALSVTLGAAATMAMPAVAHAQSMTANDAPVEIDNVVNLIGFDGVKANSAGQLTFSGSEIVFTSNKSTGSIPFTALRSFSIEHSNKGLMRGIKGTLAGFAPQGAGQLYSAIRPGAETLTLLYVDENRALHGAVAILPKNRKDDVLGAFARAGFTPRAVPMADARDTQPLSRRHIALARGEGPSVRVNLPASSAQTLPAAYVAGIYEELIAQLGKSGSFETVWRQGDVRANANALNLTVNITRVKKGNAGIRGAIPVVGMVAGKTLIEADVRLADAGGAVLLDKELKGSKRMPGESMAATKSLAQRVTSSIAQVPGFGKEKASSQVASN